MRRKLIIGCIASALLMGVAMLCLGKLRAHRQRGMMATARACLVQGDLRGAYLTAQQIRQSDPKNPQACEILAKIAERQNSPAAILYYEELANLCPGDAGIVLTLAKTAAGFGETAMAEQALARLPGAAQNTVAYHEMAAACAIQEKSFAEAAEHFEKAIELAPTADAAEILRLNLATLQVGMGDVEMARKARESLEILRKDPHLRQSATRALLVDARSQKQEQRAIQLASDLKNSPAANLQDKLSWLETIQHTANSSFDDDLSQLLKENAADPAAAYAILTWMNAHGLAQKSIQWFAQMPAASQAQISLRLAVADAYGAVADWTALRRLTSAQKGAWGALDFIRLAFQARASVGGAYDPRHKSPAAAEAWESAIVATAGNRDTLCMLARLANGWGWKSEAAQVWWLVARHQSGQRIALKELFRIASEEKDAPALYRVARRIYQLEPGNPAARNNVAMLGLLLGEDLAEANGIAADLYKNFPDSPAIASTRAFSLYLQGKSAEAEAIMAKLPKPALQQPSLAACYGIILSAEGRKEIARPYLEAALKQKSELFSQEIDLVRKALDQNLTINQQPES